LLLSMRSEHSEYKGEYTMNATLNTLINRRSIRKYSSEPVRDEDLELILRAGMFAPSGKNMQSAVMVAVTNPDEISYLSKLNAKVLGTESDPFYGAPAVIIVLSDASNYNHIYDGALVMGNLMNAAHSLGLGSCWINRAREVFASDEGKAWLAGHGIDGDLEGIGNCIIGYPAEERAAAPRKDNSVYYVR